MASNITQEKSFAFAVRITKMYLHIVNTKKEYVLSKQVLRSGTSIGANIEEGIGAQSDRDFYTKISIAYKEARETNYWLRLLKATDILETKLAESLLNDCDELLKILGTIKKKLQIKLTTQS
jgi:four helix bundle protein